MDITRDTLASWIRGLKADASCSMWERFSTGCDPVYTHYVGHHYYSSNRGASCRTKANYHCEKGASSKKKKEKQERAAAVAVAVGVVAVLAVSFLSVITYKTYANLYQAKQMLNNLNSRRNPFNSNEELNAQLKELGAIDYKVKWLKAVTLTAYLTSSVTALAGSVLLLAKSDTEWGRTAGYSTLGAAAVGMVVSLAIHHINNSDINKCNRLIVGDSTDWGLADRLLLSIDPRGVKQYMQKIGLLIENLLASFFGNGSKSYSIDMR